MITAIYAYIFTVVPVYKAGLLEEEIAQKTRVLNTTTAKLVKEETELAELTPKLKTLEKELENWCGLQATTSCKSIIPHCST